MPGAGPETVKLALLSAGSMDNMLSIILFHLHINHESWDYYYYISVV